MDPRTRAVWDSWREQIWTTYVRLETASDDDGFFGRVVRPNPGSARLSRVISTRQVTERTPSHLRSDPRDVVIVALQIAGEGGVEQDGRETRLRVGEFSLYDTTRPYRLSFEGPFEQLVLQLPRMRIDCRLPGLNRMTARRFDGRSGPGAVASGHIRGLAEIAGTLDEPALEGFEGVTADLLATAVQLAETGASAEDRASLEGLKRRLTRALADPDLSLERVAASEGVSVRSVQRLFQTEGVTFTRWLCAARLERVAEDLRSPAHSRRSITDIALAAGFGDLSHFSRMFHARFGMSARQWRTGG